MFSLFVLFAQEGGKGGGDGGSFWTMLFPLLPIAILFYFLLMRPMRRQEAERQALLTSLKKNDKVITIGGIYGSVVSVAEKEDEVVVKVDENVRLKITKSSIARNLTNEETAKAAKEQK